jgi:hypothetical protein
MTDERSEAEPVPAGVPDAPLTEAAAERMEDDPKVFVLTRELAEVHLLLDNLSSDPDTTITALSANEPPKGLEDKWIDRVCEISWPPPAGAPDKAQQAALLIRAKDYLNRLAKPASGASIAFTLLVTQREGDPDPRADRQPGFDMAETHSRASLAELAFPDFVPRAARFQRALRIMNGILLAVLFFTCLTSWYVAFGNSTLGEYATAQKRLAEAQVRVAALEIGAPTAVVAGAAALAQTAPQPAPATVAGATTQPAAQPTGAAASRTADADAGLGYCNRWTPEKRQNGLTVKRYASAEQRQACVELGGAQKQLEVVEKRLHEWLWLWGWLVDRSGGAAAIAAHVATIIGTAALPVLYGILGAGAAVLRSISHRIKASTLSPRDFSLSLQQLALGAVIGACIGLFIVQPGEEQALIGPVALSISAISFIAGFGVEAVFQALEALISRIFNIAPAASSRAEPRGR